MSSESKKNGKLDHNNIPASEVQTKQKALEAKKLKLELVEKKLLEKKKEKENLENEIETFHKISLLEEEIKNNESIITQSPMGGDGDLEQIIKLQQLKNKLSDLKKSKEEIVDKERLEAANSLSADLSTTLKALGKFSMIVSFAFTGVAIALLAAAFTLTLPTTVVGAALFSGGSVAAVAAVSVMLLGVGLFAAGKSSAKPLPVAAKMSSPAV